MSGNPKSPAIEMRGVTVRAMREPGFILVEALDWTVAAGDFWVVAGPQQSGKSDLLMVAAGLMPPALGSYKFFGTETQMFDETRLADRLRVGLVFENGQLFNRLTIAENVALPQQYHHGLSGDAAATAAQTLLELMELAPLADLTPADISVNWRKRAALARALALKPEVLLLDNPLHGLDARHWQWWLRFLDELGRGHEWLGGQPMTIVAATDDLRPWRGGARRFALLNEKKFSVLGAWNEVASTSDDVVKELLATPLAATI